MLRNNSLSNKDKFEIQANYYDCVDSVDIESLDIIDKERFSEKKLQTSIVLKDTKMSEQAFEDLKKLGASAGYLIKAYNIIGDFNNNPTINSKYLQNAKKAFLFLENEFGNFVNDHRCMNLYLKLWWTIHTKELLFIGERQSLPFSIEKLKEGLMILSALAKAEGSAIKPRTLYLSAVFNWQAQQYSIANDIWRQLQSETDFVSGKRRILKSFISSDESGKPTVFNGQIHSIYPESNRAEVFVEETSQTVSIFLSEFGMRDCNRGEAVEPFHISFNYIGPRADPIRFYENKNK